MIQGRDPEVEYVDIYKKIKNGLRTDYVDDKTSDIWKVENFINGKTKGVEVYTKYGRFLGTAYPAIEFDLPEAEGRESLYVRSLYSAMSWDEIIRVNNLDFIFDKLRQCVKEIIAGNNDYKVEKDTLMHYIYSPDFREKYHLTALDVDRRVLEIWDSLKKPAGQRNYGDLIEGILSQGSADLKKYLERLMKLYEGSHAVKIYVRKQKEIREDTATYKEFKKRRNRASNSFEKHFLAAAAAAAKKRIQTSQHAVRILGDKNKKDLNEFDRCVLELRRIYQFFTNGQARAMVSVDQQTMDDAIRYIENSVNFNAFLQTNKLTKGDLEL